MSNILVTGAAGLVGGEVCARLIARGHNVTAMVHRNPDVRANDGTLVPVNTVISGDVSKPQMGWDAAQFRAAAQSHETIIHCAATLRFDLAEAEYRAVNVDGVAHILALAQAGSMDVVHVSTAYVCGARDGVIKEDDPLADAGPDFGPESGPDAVSVAGSHASPHASLGGVGGFANGYEASKAAGERLVMESGLGWAIARPSIVVGAWDDGAIRLFDTTYAAFKLIAEGRLRHMPARQGATLDFVPIDYVADGIVTLAERMEAANGGTYHLVSAQPLMVERFTASIGAYPQFHAPELVDSQNFDPTTLPALERRLFRRVAGLYASYFQRDPHFDDSAFRALAGGGCAPTGEVYIRRLIDHCIAVGFLSSE